MQLPCPEQPPSQSGRSHAAPPHPASQWHVATAWRRVLLREGGVHTPCDEQPLGQLGVLQSKPPQPGAQTHLPGPAQRPWPEQSEGQ